MLALAVRMRSALSDRDVAPTDAVVALAARGRAPNTWNRYTSTLVQWELYAARVGSSFLPADPTHFGNFLAEAAVGALGHTQTKQRSCAIAALSQLAGVPSPVEDALVRDVRAGLRRTLRGTRGRVRPIFSYELPDADALPSLPRGRGSGPRRLAPGAAVAPLSVRKRAPAQAMSCAAMLAAAALRFDDIVEGQIGDAVVLPDVVDLSIFGLKTDSNLSGQPAVLPGPAVPGTGAHAFLDGIAALPPAVLQPLAARFRASFTAREVGQGALELAAWPADIRALAAPLYAAGLPVHCLPLYGQWQHTRLTAESDLGEGVSRPTFLALTTHILASEGVEVAGMAGHSFRRGRAEELFHGQASRETVAEVLRHRSVASTRPYITDAARVASLAVTITAASVGRGSPGGPARLHASMAGPPGGAPRPLAPPGRLYTHPRQAVRSPTGSFAYEPTSIRQLLTFLSYWRGAGAPLFPEGEWPHQFEHLSGQLSFELGPSACP